MNKFYEKFKDLDEIDSEKSTKYILQSRGREFEKLINSKFEEEGILLRRSYHTSDNRSEEIDGAIEVNNRVFLIEVKWVDSNLAASALFSFIGKIENKFHGTLGVFISRNKLTSNFINALNKGRRQSVIVIHGDDVRTILESGIKFQDYISCTSKVLSYDNKIQLPIDQYLHMIEKKEIGKTTPNSNDFFTTYLTQTAIDENKLQIAIDELEPENKDKIFRLILNKYGEYYNDAFENFDGEKFKIIDNFTLFLERYTPSDVIIKELVNDYYSTYARNNPIGYSLKYFIEIFSPFYKTLPKKIRTEFEKTIIYQFNPASREYHLENAITKICELIWEDLKEKTRRELMEEYLNIFISESRNDTFPQKSFAIKLMEEKLMPKDLLYEWLDKKLKIDKDANPNLTDYQIKIIANAYRAIAESYEVKQSKWIEFIKNRIKNIA